MTLGTKVLKHTTPATPCHQIESWFEVIAHRKCRACCWEDTRTKISPKWNDRTQNDEVQRLKASFQRELEHLTTALTGNIRLEDDLRPLQDLINVTYQDVWIRWFGGAEPNTNATLLVWESEHSAGYHRDLDTIEITIQSATPDEPGALRPETWPSWKCELLHEMLHELESKTQFAPSEAGIQLFRNSTKKFPNHPPEDLRFFTAIVDTAESVSLTPERFLELL